MNSYLIKNPFDLPEMVKIFFVSVSNQGKTIRYQTLSGKIMERMFQNDSGILLKELEIEKNS